MPLSTRELYLVLRARDEASRVLRNVSGSIRGLDKQVAEAAQRNIHHGQALATIGVGVAASAAVGLQALNNMTDAAMEYHQQAARTITQADELATKLELIKDVGREIARAIPVPFEQVQDTLYDIFSSMDVNASQAAKLARQFAKNAVGGAVDIKDAGRAAITILNAWSLPVKNVTKVSDVFFQMVRKGVGTHEEFTRTIGRSIPSAVRAGQTFEDMAGGLAFLTRAGLSTAMASTSLGRAFDALSNPKSINNLKELGVKVKNAKGEFLPLTAIIDQMRKKTEGMAKPEKSDWLATAFKGSGGTIQAMRFFNLALDDSDKSLDKHTEAMRNAAGVSDHVYKIMANTPAAKVQEFNNRLAILRTEIGDRLIPIKMRLIDWVLKLFDAWDNLSPRTKDLIVKITLLVGALGVVIGIVTTVAGIFLMLKGAMVIAGVSLAGFIGPIAIVVAAIAALAVGIYFLIKHWDSVKPALVRFGTAVKKYVLVAIDAIVKAAQALWEGIKRVASAIWGDIGPHLILIWNEIKTAALSAWGGIKDAVMDVWHHAQPALASFMTTIRQLGEIVRMVASYIIDFAKAMWPSVKQFLTELGNGIKHGAIIALKILAAAFVFVATIVKNVVPPLIRIIGGVLVGIWNIISSVVGLIYSLMKGDWKKAWEYARKLVGSIVATIINLINGLLSAIFGLIKGLVLGVINFFKSLYNTLVGHSIIPDMVRAIIRWFAMLPIQLVAIARRLWQDVVQRFREGWTAAKNLVTTGISYIRVRFAEGRTAIVETARKMWSEAVQKFKDGWTALKTVVNLGVIWIRDKFANAKNWLTSAGSNIVAGLKSGIVGAITGISSWIKNRIVDPIINAVKRWFGIHSPSTVFFGFGVNLLRGLIGGLASTKAGTIIKNIFGSMPKALGSLVSKGVLSLASLPRRALDAIGSLPAKFLGKLKNVGGRGRSGILAVARANGAPANPHRDPQGGPAFDITASGAKNSRIAETLRKFHAQYGIRYVISQMRIASARNGWAWRRYTPITNRGDFRHVGHVHVSYARGGWINEHVVGMGQRTGKFYQFGERGRELVTPENKVGDRTIQQHFHIVTQEIDPRKHAADLGWEIATRVA